MKKLLLLVLCVTIVATFTGCGGKGGSAQKDGKMSEKEVEKIFKKMKDEECKVDNNIFTWLEPTHKQANPYPYDYIYDGWGDSAKEYLAKVGHLLWSPNKPIIAENVKSIKFAREEYTSFDEVLEKNIEDRNFLEIDLDEKTLGFEGNNLHYTNDSLTFEANVTADGYDELTLKEAIEKNIWTYTDVPWATQWFYENGDFENITSESHWDVLEQLIKDWGMPTEVYYNVNESTGFLTSYYAELYWDCAGYDVVYYIEKSSGMFEIRSAIVYGDGWSEYVGKPIIEEDSDDNKRLE